MTPEERAEARRLPKDTLNMLLSHLEAHSPQTVASITRHIDSLMDTLEAAERERDEARDASAAKGAALCGAVNASSSMLVERDTARAQVEKLTLFILCALEDLTAPMADDASCGSHRAIKQLNAALKAAGVET